jgi:protein O-mannosyl-transferase
MKLNKNLIFIILLFFAVLVSYANIFQNQFAWDDFFFIEDNIQIRNVDNIPSFFTLPSTGNLYRPVRQVFYAVNYQVWGLSTFGYHLNSLLLHFFVTLLFYFITIKITNRINFSFVAALFFAVHPVHVARITNMTASFDVLGILFLLLAFFFYIIFSQIGNKNYHYFSIIFYFLGLFSSEEAITLILLLLLYDFSFKYKINLSNVKISLKKYLPYFVVTVFYLIVRFSVLGKIGRTEAYFEQSFIGSFLTTIKIFVQYILVLLFPSEITIERYVKFETTIFSFSFLASLIVLIFILSYFVKSYNRSKIMFFSVGWFFITLLPFSNLVPQFTIMADRYLYLPSFGFVLFLTFLVFNIGKFNSIKKYQNKVIPILVLLIISFYVAVTVKTNSEWKDNFTLLSANLEKNPYGTRTHYAVALHYRNQDDYESAEHYALRAVELASRNYNAYENLGTIYAYRGNYDAAINYYNKALELNPKFYLANNNLGLVHSYIGDFNSSIFYLNKAIEINPRLSKAYNDLGTVYGQMGKLDIAIENIEKAININPSEGSYYKNLAVIYEFLGNKKKAAEFIRKASELTTFRERLKER